ncbi:MULTISPECIES: SHOCT domain-containing protein [unclassified Maridesulfovibrio]|uniref:SHOCT domain-containing protein n=1 Tax=unclassified Maridesulfovibrio TaxID=2794999 RepID=UPI003B40CDC6
MEEQKIFQLTYHEMMEIVDDEIVNEMDGPERGFTTRLTFGLDWYNVIVKIVPVEGVSLDGQNVRGYFVELGGRGTYATSRPKRLIMNVQNKLEESGTGVVVSSYRRIPYEYERDRWRLNSKPSARESGDVVDKMLKLKILRDEGVLTEEEFKAKKQSLLERL